MLSDSRSPVFFFHLRFCLGFICKPSAIFTSCSKGAGKPGTMSSNLLSTPSGTAPSTKREPAPGCESSGSSNTVVSPAGSDSSACPIATVATTSSSAPSARNVTSTASRPRERAAAQGVKPPWSLCLGSAPASASTLTTSAWPYQAATKREVWPNAFSTSKCTPPRINSRILSRSPRAAAFSRDIAIRCSRNLSSASATASADASTSSISSCSAVVA
mmetsp:Transcript_85063/g.273823  ORF Transcript_85063/g.273823 Transcript_85063/m.273823 type:complete len:217 (+) Transcript_85063:691-1341(+)